VPDPGEHSIADMAVALTLARTKLGLDLEKTKMIAERIGLSRMGYELIVPQLQQDIDLVLAAAQLLKDLADIEPQVRAMIARKKRGSWMEHIRGVAAL
jgi:hypothetical protein